MSIKGELEGRTWGILAVGLMCLLALSQGLQAGGRASGARVRVVTRLGSEQFKGEVLGVRAEAIVLETEQGEGRTVAIADISSVRIYRTSAVLPGIFVGALAGGAMGYAISAPANSHVFLGDITIAAYSIGGALLGAASGGLVGGLASADKTYDLTKMSAAEVDTLMAKLRKMARVKNYQ
jgi:hypothetical protein